MAIEFKVVPSPTNKNWKVLRDDEEIPLVFADSKEDAMKLAKHMADGHDGKVVAGDTKAKKKAAPKKASRKKAA